MIEARDKDGKWHLIQWNTIPFNGNEARTDSYTICGLAIRDALNWESAPHNYLPEDISDGAKDFVNDWREKDYGFGDTTNFFHMYLDELFALAEERFKKLSEQRKNYEKELQIGKIANQLDRIEDFLYSGMKSSKKKDSRREERNENSDFESTAQYLEEEYRSTAFLESEISDIYTLAREISGETYIEYKDVRVIMWYI